VCEITKSLLFGNARDVIFFEYLFPTFQLKNLHLCNRCHFSVLLNNIPYYNVFLKGKNTGIFIYLTLLAKNITNAEKGVCTIQFKPTRAPSQMVPCE